MNHVYRLVFNRALGVMQVASELAHSPHGGASYGAVTVTATLPRLRFALWVALGFVGFTSPTFGQQVQGESQGRITADPNAPGAQRPTVLDAGNGVPVVNITTPSAGGVSRNTYSQFDVGAQGAILNNSRTNATTQLAGSIAGNPWLATGTAKVILNEVNSSDPSQLNGYVEVAGVRAQVVIANPAGIQVNGGGFINTSRATLTTGTPVFAGGSLDHYRVEGGAITVDGAGLDASRTDYTDLIARSVHANAGLWAQQLQVTLGANTVRADHAQVTPNAAGGTAPTFALDVGALGGMYANKVWLVGTEHGVGMRNAGTIGAAAGDLVVTTDGRLENSGNLQSQQNVNITANGGMANAGTVSATRELTVTTPADLDNSDGTINAGRIEVTAQSLRNRGGSIEQTGLQVLALQMGSLSNRDGGRIGIADADAGPDTGGTDPGNGTGGGSTGGSSGADTDSGTGGGVPSLPVPLADGALRIAGHLDNDGGAINAGGGVSLSTANGLDNSGGRLGLRELTLTQGDLGNAGGELNVAGNANLHVGRINNDAGRFDIGGALQVDAQALSNRGGTLTQGGTGVSTILIADTLDNSDGVFATNATTLSIESGALVNEAGRIEHAGADGLQVKVATLRGADGTIVTAGAATVSAATVDHCGATLSAAQVALDADGFDNRGGTIAMSGPNANALGVRGVFDNGGGTLASSGDLAITAGTFGNAGGTVQQAGTGVLTIDAITLNGAGGTLASNGALTIAGEATDLRGGTTFAQAIAIDTGTLSTAGGKLTALGTDALELTANDALDNSAGTIAGNGVLQLAAGALTNTDGVITAVGVDTSTVIVAGTLDNTRGTLAAAGNVEVHAGDLLNAGGTLQTAGTSALTVTADRLNNAAGTIASGGDLAVMAGALDNTAGGRIEQAGQGALTIVASMLNGSGGTIASNGTLTLTGDVTDLGGGTTFAQAIAIDTGTLTTAGGALTATGTDVLDLRVRGALDNTAGTIATNGALAVTAQSLTNRGGTLSAAGTDATQIAVADTLDNTGGSMAAAGAASVQAGDLVNQRGTLQAAEALRVSADGRLDNSNGGVLTANGDMAITAGTLDNTAGAIAHAGDGALSIAAATLNGAGGSIAGNGALTLTGQTTDLSGGSTSAGKVSVDTGTLITAGGRLTATGSDALALTARERLDNTTGAIATNGGLQISAGALNNTDGAITAAGTGASSLAVGGTLNNTRGILAIAGATAVVSGEFLNVGGTLQAASDAVLTVRADGRLVNDGGTIASNGAIDLTVHSLSNGGGAVQTQQAITATVADTLDNTDGTVVAGGNLTLAAGSLINRDTFDPNIVDPTAQTGLFGALVTLQADAIDNTRGQIQAADALTLAGRMQAATTLTNASGTIDGSQAITVTASSFDNTGGALVQRGADGALTLNVDGTLNNTTGGLIGAEGDATLQAGTVDNTTGTVFATGDLAVTGNGDVLNRADGVLQSSGDLTVSAGGSLDNTDGTIDASGRAVLTAARIDNVRGQALAGEVTDAASLTVGTSALNNQGGTVGTREGDLELNVATVDNRAGGKLVAQRDIALNTTALNNAGGTVFATRNLAYENTGGSLDNAGGQLGAGETARITLATVGNVDGGRIQAGTVWLATPNLDITGGEVAANTLHANLTTLTGLGRLYGAQWLDADFSGDFTYASGQKFESDVLLDLMVAGTFTNLGTLQAAGELALAAVNLTNQGTINASNDSGTGWARITVNGTLDNQRGASLEGDTLALSARDLTNTGDIVGDVVGVEADTLTNGRDLAQLLAVVDYGEGFIGAAEYLELRVGQRLSNLDGDLFSAGDLAITGRAVGTRVGLLENVSGRIQAEGNAMIAADSLDNRRRVIAMETYTLTPEEQYALSSERQYDNALTPAEQQRLIDLGNRTTLTTAERAEQLALMRKVGWIRADNVSDAMLATLNAELRRIAITKYGAQNAYLVDNASTPTDNPTAELHQVDTYDTGERLVTSATSAASEIVSGGDLTIDTGTQVRNYASRIAAGRNLLIAGQAFDPSSPDARIENVAVVGQYSGIRDTTAWIRDPEPIQYLNGSGWHPDTATFAATMTEQITATGPVLAAASITAGQGLTIEAGDVTNTSVTVGGGLSSLDGGALSGPGSTGLGVAGEASAGTTAAIDTVSGTGVAAGAGPDASHGSSVNQGGDLASAAPQVVGTPEHPLPGLVPADNGMFDVHADSSSPFLVTTAPRFAKGDGTGSNYLLGRLGLTTDLHKRLGDGYYEQRLVLEQILQLTGRRTLTGNGDGFEQYRVLMDHAAAEAARLGFTLGAPLTSAQIGALDQDIVWLVEQEVNGQKVLVPVVYLSKATAARMQAEGALIAADVTSIQSSGAVRNDGTLGGSRGTWLSADTLINDGAIRSDGRVDIATLGDTINRGKVVGQAVSIDAGGDVVNAVRFTGINATAGTIEAGAGGLQVTAARDVINQGTMNSAGHAIVSAGRDFVQNSATTESAAGGVSARAGHLTAGGSAVVSTGRDAVLDQSAITAGQHAIVDAGRDAKFTASAVQTGGSIAVTAGRDIVSATVTDTATQVVHEKQGRTKTTATTVDETLRGSTFEAGGDIAMVAGQDITLTAATVHSDDGAVALSAGRDVNLLAGEETHSITQDSVTKKKGTFSSSKTTTHDEVTGTYAIGTSVSGETVRITAGNDYHQVGSSVAGDDGVRIAASHDVTIESAQDTLHEEHAVTTKKSGLTGGYSGGVASVGYSRSSSSAQSTTDSTTQVASTVASLDGNVTVVAGNRMTIAASDLAAGENLTLSAKDIELQARQDTVESHVTQSSKSSGFSVGVTLDPGAAYRSARDATTANMTDSGGTLSKLSSTAEGMASGTRAATTAVVVQAGSQKSNGSQDDSTSDARVTQLAAGGNLTVLATDGSITSEGAQMSAEGNALLLAKDDITFDVAHNTETAGSQNKGSGWSVANNTTGLPVGMYHNKDNGNGATDTITGTQLSVGGSTRMATLEGDITLTAANVVSEGDVDINAARNLTVQSGQDTASNANHADNKAVGTVVISDTERFMGYHTEKHNDDGAQVTQVASNIASLTGDANMSAGGKYTQIASNVLAADNVNVTAREIELLTADNLDSGHEDNDALKVGVFARVRSPLIDLINNVDAARESDGRLEAMQGMAAAASVYQAASAIGGSGALFSAEAGIGFATNEDQRDYAVQSAQASTISGGGNVTLTSTTGDIHVVQGNLKAGDTLTLDSADDIVLEAGRSTVNQAGSSSNLGAEVGVGVSVGAQTGVYVYAQASAGSSSDHTDITANENTHLTADTINLRSRGDTTLRGADARANTINADVGGALTIESVQDTVDQSSESSQVGARVQVSIGTAWDASGSASSSQANGSYRGVKQQSGLFAGEGGFEIDVAGDTSLTGGVISSSQTAIDAQRNHLTTGTLTTRDIQNRAEASASSSGVTVSSDMFSGKYGAAKGVAGNALDNGASSDSEAGVTRSAVSPATIVITDREGQLAKTGKTAEEAIANLSTDTANANQIINPQDVDAVRSRAEAERFAKGLVYEQAVKLTDEAYRTMFLKEAKIYEVTKDPETGEAKTRALTEAEKLQMQAGPDGKVNLATNGIFNGKYDQPEAAATYALQHNVGDGPLYLVHFPEASNGLSELLVAGYQKFLESDLLGLTNATAEVRDAMLQYGQTGLHLDGHSRGAMTIGNSMESLMNLSDAQGSLSGTTISFFGPAYNAADADGLLGALQNRNAVVDSNQRSAMTLTYQNHAADFVGRLLGGNPATGGTIPEGSSWLSEMKRVLGGENTVHSCYGTTSAELCHQLWSTSPGEQAEFRFGTHHQEGTRAPDEGTP